MESPADQHRARKPKTLARWGIGLVALLEATTPPSFAVERSQTPEVAVEIAEDQSIDRMLSTGQTHRYRLSLDPARTVQLEFQRWGIDVDVAIQAPNGEVIRVRPCRDLDPVSLSAMTQSGGEHFIIVRPIESANVTGRYRLVVRNVRTSTPEDVTRIAAEQEVAKGNELRSQWNREAATKALAQYESALGYWQELRDEIKQAETLSEIGEVHFELGDSDKALALYSRAITLAQKRADIRLAGKIKNQIGFACWRLGRYEEASSAFTEGSLLGRESNNRHVEAKASVGIGDVHYALGSLREALDCYQRALESWKELSSRRGQAQTLINLGYTHADLSEDQQALTYFTQALELWRQVGDRRGEAEALRVMGSVYAKLDEKQKALESFDQARHIFGPMGDRTSQATLSNSIGQLYYDLNQIDKALFYHQEALRLGREIGHKLVEGAALIQIGRCKHSSHQDYEALDHYHEALKVFRSSKDERMTSVALGEIAKVYESLGDSDRAVKHFEDALDMKRVGGDKRAVANTLNDLGGLHHRSGASKKAAEYFTEALGLYQIIGDRYGESLSLYNLARIARDNGDLVDALSMVQESLDIGESLRVKVSSPELRAPYFALICEYYELNTDLLMQLHSENPSKGFDKEALMASEKARARSLLDSLLEAQVDIRQGVDTELLTRERSLHRSLNRLVERQIRLLGKNANQDEMNSVAADIQKLTAEYEQLQSVIRSKSPRYSALTKPGTIRLEEIQQQVLDSDTLLLEYALGSEHSYLWMISKESYLSFELPPRTEIESRANGLYELLTARQPLPGESMNEYRTRAREAESRYWKEASRLAEIILEPIAEHLEQKRLLIVSDGELQYIPFATLPDPSEEKPVPLIVRHEIVRLPSATTLVMLRKETAGRTPGDKDVAVIADPVFEVDDPRLAKRAPDATKTPDGKSQYEPESPPATSYLHRALRDAGMMSNGRLRIPRLPSTRHEARTIAGLATPGASMIAMDFEANRDTAISSSLGRYRNVHFATHGLLNSESPELSGIILSMVDQDGRPQNGFLRLHDIYNLDLPVEMVVLSACSSALGKEVRGEGLVGIVQGFLYAGAKRVLASLWKVDDEATGKLMEKFYRFMLVDKLGPAESLRRSQIEMWQSKEWNAPFYWAAFVIQGDWK